MSFKGNYSLGQIKGVSSKEKLYLMEDADEEEENEVQYIDNNIYFYCSVTMKTILDLTLIIKKLTTKLIMRIFNLQLFKPIINLYINSEGGDN